METTDFITADGHSVGLIREHGRSPGRRPSLCLSVKRKGREKGRQREPIMISCAGQEREWEGDPNPECLFGGTSAPLAVN